jgi:hypothetical protein
VVNIYPEEFFAVTADQRPPLLVRLLDPRAAEIALRDPAWAPRGPLGRHDRAADRRHRHHRARPADFPFLRNFDAYEGHSWASASAWASSATTRKARREALNAWAGLILWGEVHGQQGAARPGHLPATPPRSRPSTTTGSTSTARCSRPSTRTSRSAGVRRQVPPQHLVDRRPAPDQGHQPAADDHGVTPTSERDPTYVRAAWPRCRPRQKICGRIAKKPSPIAAQGHLAGRLRQVPGAGRPAAALKTWDRWGAVELGDAHATRCTSCSAWPSHGHARLQHHRRHALYQVFKRPDGSAPTWPSTPARRRWR